MITLTIPPQALHNAFRVENTVDLRDLALCGIGAEVMWMLVPVYAVAENLPLKKRVAGEMPTRIEFASTPASSSGVCSRREMRAGRQADANSKNDSPSAVY